MSIEDKVEIAAAHGVAVEVTALAPDWHECRAEGREPRSFTAAALLRGEFEQWLGIESPAVEEEPAASATENIAEPEVSEETKSEPEDAGGSGDE